MQNGGLRIGGPFANEHAFGARTGTCEIILPTRSTTAIRLLALELKFAEAAATLSCNGAASCAVNGKAMS